MPLEFGLLLRITRVGMTNPIPSTTAAPPPPSAPSPTMVRRSNFRARVLEEFGGETTCDQKSAILRCAKGAPPQTPSTPEMELHPSKPSPPDEEGKSSKPRARTELAQTIPNVVNENVVAIVLPTDTSPPSGTAGVGSKDIGASPQQSAPVVLASEADIVGAKETSQTATTERSWPQGKRDLAGLQAFNAKTAAEAGKLDKVVGERDKADLGAELQGAAPSSAALARKESKHEGAPSSKAAEGSAAKNILPRPISNPDTGSNEVAGNKKSLGANTTQLSDAKEISTSPTSSNSDGSETQLGRIAAQNGNATDPSQAVSITSVVVTAGAEAATPNLKNQQPDRDARVSAPPENSDRPPTATRHSENGKETAPSLVSRSDGLHRPPETKGESLPGNQMQIPSGASATACLEAAHSGAEARSGPAHMGAASSRDAGLPRGIPEPTSSFMPGMVREAYFGAGPKQTEMHIDLRTTSFGSIEVHAVIRDSQVGLAIGSERGDLRHLLSMEVPALEGRLQRHDLQLDSVRFIDPGQAFDAGTSSGNPPQQRPAAYARNSHIVDPGGEPSPIVSVDPDALLINSPGLNIRA